MDLQTLLQFAVLGVGAGSLYSLGAIGLVVVYRGSGVLNFAQGAIGMACAFVFGDVWRNDGWPLWLALLFAVALGAALGLAVHFFAMRPLRHASGLTKLIATLAVLIALQFAVATHYGTNTLLIPGIFGYPQITVGGSVLPADRLYLLAISAGLTVILTAAYRLTRFGLATSAVAEDETGIAGLGWSPNLIAGVNWAIGGALAGLASSLVAPIVGLDIVNLTLLVIPSLAAALLGGFSSFIVTFLCGIGIGVAESLIVSQTTLVGLPSVVPFAIIVGIVVIRGRGLPVRSEATARMPRLGSGRMRPRIVIPAVAAGVATLWLLPPRWVDASTTSVIFAITLLSLVVVTGLAGQLSLAQYMLAGMGGWIAASLVATWHVPVEIAFLAGVAGTFIVGLVFGLPALRTRGANLAIVTLALGLVIQNMILANSDLTGGLNGTNVGNLRVFGINVSGAIHPQRYATLTFLVFVLLLLMVANLRRSRVGRQLAALRSNERAAAAVGINIGVAKLYAFSLSAAIAAIAGIFTVFRFNYANYYPFTIIASIQAVAAAVIGGIGYVSGPIFGSLLAPGGIGYEPFAGSPKVLNVLQTASGLLLLGILIGNPNGLASTHNLAFIREHLRLRKGGKRQAEARDLPAFERPQIARVPLTVETVSVRFGGVTAVDGVSLDVQPGEIHGLIGPNGAGKTTLIDAISGFVRVSSGQIAVGEMPIVNVAAHVRTSKGVTRSFQSLELFEDLTVANNLRSVDPIRHRDFVTGLVWPKEQDLTPGALAAITEFGISSFLDLEPGELSYGQRRLVAVARAAAALPSILLLDEPSAGLDESFRPALASLIKRLAKEWGIGVLLVEHDIDMISSLSDRVTVLNYGRVLSSGPPEQILRDRAVIAAYIGDDTSTQRKAAAAGLTA